MRWGIARLLAFLVLLCAGPAAFAEVASTEQPLYLRGHVPQIQADELAGVWLDPRGQASIGQASQAPYRRPAADAVYSIPADGVLWMHLRLQRGSGERQEWLLKFPTPGVDQVTVFQRGHGEWRAETAGDTLAVREWPERGRYPFFRLELPPGEVRDVYVRIRNATPAHIPVQLVTAARHAEQVQLEHLWVGAALGALLLLITGCLAKSWAYRDAAFAWYALYASLTSLAVASFTGVAGHLLWPGFGALQDAPKPVLACAAVAVALLFVRTTLGLRRRLPLHDRLIRWLGLLGLVLAPLPLVAGKALYVPLLGSYMIVASLAALLAAGSAWWRGDAVARWVFAAQLPMAWAVIATALRALGWANLAHASHYLVVVGLTVEVPLLLVALFIRSRDRHGAEVREQALSSQDALTGLLAPHLFSDRLRQVVARFRRDDENAAVMYIDLVNHGRIREVFGAAVAEQSLLRSVIKLRRLLRDVDTVSRVGEARFGVILEGASSRSSVTERATRLIAAGLMPLPGLKPDVTLQFHVAALLLCERPLDADEAHSALDAQLSRMAPRTRRPIRFIQPDQDLASDPGQESVMFTPDGGPESATSACAPAP